MKLSIKHSSGATIDIDGSQEECLAALHALFGYPPVNLTGISVQPAVQPFTPAPIPWTPTPYPSPITPWSPIIWGTLTTNEQRAPWAHGTLLMTYNQNTPQDPTQPSGYRVEHHGVPGGTTTVKLQPLSQGEVFREMGLTWAADALQGKALTFGALGTQPIDPSTVRVATNDFDKSSVDVAVSAFMEATRVQPNTLQHALIDCAKAQG